MAIQAAFDSIPLMGTTGARVRFANGTYHVTLSINLPLEVVEYGLPMSTVYISGDGAVLYTDQPNVSIFKRWPTGAAISNPNIPTSTAFVIDGLTFTGTSLRTQIGVDLGCTYSARITNCRFMRLGRGLRLSYAMMPVVENCIAHLCVISGYTFTDGYPEWATDSNYWVTNTGIARSCRVYCADVVNHGIEGMTAANPCVVTWTNHNLSTGDVVFFGDPGGIGGGAANITQTNWTALNGRRFKIIKLSDNTFSLQILDRADHEADLDTSTFGDYVPGTDPGTMHAAVFGFEFLTGTVDLKTCTSEGGNPTDAIFFYTRGNYGLNVDTWHQENAPYGAALYMNTGSAAINLTRFGGTRGNLLIDAYDMSHSTSGVVDIKYIAKGDISTQKIRLPGDAANAGLQWIIENGGPSGGGFDMTNGAAWYGGVPPHLTSIEVYDGHYRISDSTAITLRGTTGVYVRPEPNGPYSGGWFSGLRSETDNNVGSGGGGGVGAYDGTNGQAIMMKQVTTLVTSLSAGAAHT